MTKLTGAHPKSLLTAFALALALLILPASAQAGSGGVGPGGTGGGGSGSGDGRSSGDIEGLNPAYAKFSELLAGQTELSLRVVGAWTLAEGGPKDNPLNIGPGKRYGTVNKGVRATATLLQHSMYEDVLASVDEPDKGQIDAIVASPWCPGCRGYKRLLRSTYKNVEVTP